MPEVGLEGVFALGELFKEGAFAIGEVILGVELGALLGDEFRDAVEEEEAEGVALRGDAGEGEELFDEGAVVPEELYVFVGEVELAEAVEAEGGDFEVELAAEFGGVPAEHIYVPLKEFAKAAFLGALGTVAAGNAEPLDGAGEGVGLGGDHAGEGGGEFGAEGEFLFVLAAAFEVEKLGDDFVAGFDLVEVEELEGGAIDLEEAMAEGDASPGIFDVAAEGHLVGVEVTGAGGGLESSSHGGSIGGKGEGGKDGDF